VPIPFSAGRIGIVRSFGSRWQASPSLWASLGGWIQRLHSGDVRGLRVMLLIVPMGGRVMAFMSSPYCLHK
jgi:hypothetical protein